MNFHPLQILDRMSKFHPYDTCILLKTIKLSVTFFNSFIIDQNLITVLMKQGILMIGLLCSVAIQAQTKRFVETYRRETGYFKTLTVPMSFDSDSIDRERPDIEIGQVYRVDYIATTHEDTVTAYQRRLDSKRWSELYRFTGINPKGSFEKNIFYQTQANNEEDARLLFHGFVVYYE